MIPNRLLAIAVFSLIAGFIVWSILRAPVGEGDTQSEVETPLLPELSETPFLNALPDAKFIGTPACATCHPRQDQSYRLTAHSRALSIVDPANEPPDATLKHEPSGRSYRIYRKEGRLWHEETLLGEDGGLLSRIELPVRYLIGSGQASRTYLFEVDGFLHESPLTWYASTGRWGLSPGYDFPQHWSFERPVRIDCLICHSGRVEPLEGSDQRVAFHELSIGCESCHGPGSKHREVQTARTAVAGQPDRTIVHPGRLPRELLESVCATCHQNGVAAVDVRGRSVRDFRPGRPLSDFRIHFQLESEREQMTVTGHVEQSRQSLCYQKSDSLSCITCHDPHAASNPREKPNYYREKCLTCHSEQSCRSPLEPRRKLTPPDNCVTCHMPKGDTDIPHLAFTHHRIGKHTAPRPGAGPASPSSLALLDENPGLSQGDRQRNLGMAYLEASRNGRYSQFSDPFRRRGLELLQAASNLGVRDAESTFARAEGLWYSGENEASGLLAQKVVDSPELGADSRARCLALLANRHRQSNDLPAAIATLERATKLRRFADDWRMIGVNRLDLGMDREALEAFQKALAIRPSRHSTRLGLAECYRRLGDPSRAKEELRIAEALSRQRRD